MAQDNKQETVMQQAAIALYYHAAQMIKAGKSREEIERHLIHDKGIKPQTARNMLDKLNESRANVARRAGYRNIIMAVLVLMLGITILTGIGGDGSGATGIRQFVAMLIIVAGGMFGVRALMQIFGL